MNDMGESLLGFLVEIRNSDTCSEDGIIGMFRGEVGSSLSGKVLNKSLDFNEIMGVNM